MVYKHAYLNTLLLLHSASMLCMAKMPLKREVGGHALKVMEITCTLLIMENHGKIMDLFLNFCGNPDLILFIFQTLDLIQLFCDQQSFKYLRLDGQTPVGKRQELVQRFNDKHIHDCKFMKLLFTISSDWFIRRITQM